VGINSLAAGRENALPDRADWLPGMENALSEVQVELWASENGVPDVPVLVPEPKVTLPAGKIALREPTCRRWQPKISLPGSKATLPARKMDCRTGKKRRRRSERADADRPGKTQAVAANRRVE
jgi:hypothetical protein